MGRGVYADRSIRRVILRIVCVLLSSNLQTSLSLLCTIVEEFCLTRQ